MSGIGQWAVRAAHRLHVRSALNPVLWLTAIATPVCFTAAYLFRFNGPILWALIVAGFLPIMAVVLGFCYFAIVEPGKLQSEDYQLRHETLQIIQQKSGQLIVETASLTAVANPSLPALPLGGEPDK
jgi:membrane protein implicated in regulation of membrane protease activity